MHKIGIIMGSDSDLRIMREAAQTCAQFHIAHEVTIVSAHRTPERLLDYGKTAAARGLRVIIAHLPGMIAAVTPLPVIGVPIHSSNSIDGWDSVLSILQMPAGVPVATVALDGAKNAALLALRILGASDDTLRNRLAAYQDEMRQNVLDKADALKNEYPCDYR